MKRQADKNSVRHNKRAKESLSSRRNYRNHESSRDNGRDTRDDKYSSSRSYSRQKPSPRERDTHLSPEPYRDGSKREARDRKSEKTFRMLAVENFSSQISNEDIEESLYFEYRKFGDVSVRVVERHGTRTAYVTFKYPECAVDAKNAKGALVMHDRRLIVEAVYERKTSGHQNEKKYDSDNYDRKNKETDNRERRDRRSNSMSPIRQRRSRSHSPVRSNRYENEDRNYKRSPGRYDDNSYRKHSVDYDEDSRFSNNSPETIRGVENDLLPEDDPYATRVLHVANLDGHASHNSIRRLFEQYGRIDDVDIKHSSRGQNSHAYIRFANLDDAHKAKVSMHGRTAFDNVIKVGYGNPVLSSKLWIGGLGSWISLGTLEREFDRFGSIRKIDYERGSDFAYVLYDSLDAAREACSQMRGATMPGSDIRLRIDFADPVPGLPGWDEWESRKSEKDDNRRGNIDRYQNDRRYSRGGRGRNSGFEGRGRYDRKFRDDRDRFNRGNRQGGYNRRRSISPRNDEDQFGGPEIDPQLLFKQAQAKGVVDLHQLCEVFNPPLWDGCIIAKKTAFAVRFFALDGNLNVLYNFLENNTPESNIDLGTFLNMNQKLKLENEDKIGKIEKCTTQFNNKWCLLLAVPGMPTIVNIAGGKNSESIYTKQRPLRGLVKYFKDKNSAGVVTMTKQTKNTDTENTKENSKEISEMMYAFPPSKFAKAKLFALAPNLNEEVIIDEYLLVIIIRNSQSR